MHSALTPSAGISPKPGYSDNDKDLSIANGKTGSRVPLGLFSVLSFSCAPPIISRVMMCTIFMVHNLL